MTRDASRQLRMSKPPPTRSAIETQDREWEAADGLGCSTDMVILLYVLVEGLDEKMQWEGQCTVSLPERIVRKRTWSLAVLNE